MGGDKGGGGADEAGGDMGTESRSQRMSRTGVTKPMSSRIPRKPVAAMAAAAALLAAAAGASPASAGTFKEYLGANGKPLM